MTTATRRRGHLQPVRDEATVLPFKPLSADQEDAIAATLSPDALLRVNDAFERALELLAGGASLLQIVTGVFHAGSLHGYEAALEDLRGGPVA